MRRGVNSFGAGEDGDRVPAAVGVFGDPGLQVEPGQGAGLSGDPDAGRETGGQPGPEDLLGHPGADHRAGRRRPGLVPPDQREQPGDLPGGAGRGVRGVEDPHGPDPLRRQRGEDPGELRLGPGAHVGEHRLDQLPRAAEDAGTGQPQLDGEHRQQVRADPAQQQVGGRVVGDRHGEVREVAQRHLGVVGAAGQTPPAEPVGGGDQDPLGRVQLTGLDLPGELQHQQDLEDRGDHHLLVGPHPHLAAPERRTVEGQVDGVQVHDVQAGRHPDGGEDALDAFLHVHASTVSSDAVAALA